MAEGKKAKNVKWLALAGGWSFGTGWFWGKVIKAAEGCRSPRPGGGASARVIGAYQNTFQYSTFHGDRIAQMKSKSVTYGKIDTICIFLTSAGKTTI